MRHLFHILAESTWRSTVTSYQPDSLTRDGFIHLSYREQVHATGRRHYLGQPNLVVLEIDPEQLFDPIRVEDTSGVGQSFPHLYGPLPTAAVIAVHPIEDFSETTAAD